MIIHQNRKIKFFYKTIHRNCLWKYEFSIAFDKCNSFDVQHSAGMDCICILYKDMFLEISDGTIEFVIVKVPSSCGNKVEF